MRLFEIFDKTRIDEYREYIDSNMYGSWINVNGTVDDVDMHERWLEDNYGNAEAYEQAFDDGWVRTVNSNRFNIEGTEDNLRKTFKYWWPTAINSDAVYISIAGKGNRDYSDYKVYHMPEGKAKLRQVFGPQPMNVDEEKYIIKQKVHLPDDVIKAFEELGRLQRGDPEAAMLKVQFAMGGGVLNPVVEHVGDLTHRMSHMAKYGNMGHEFVSEKVDKTLRWLTSGYGFEREFQENLQNNAKHSGVPIEQYIAKVDATLKKYANEHKKLPVYNKVQWLAKEAAVAVGEKNFDLAVKFLEALKRYTNNVDTFNEAASKFYKDNAGNLIQYKPGMTESTLEEEKK